MMGSYYGSLKLPGLGKQSQMTECYEKEYMESTAESFCSWTLELSDAATDSRGQRREM